MLRRVRLLPPIDSPDSRRSIRVIEITTRTEKCFSGIACDGILKIAGSSKVIVLVIFPTPQIINYELQQKELPHETDYNSARHQRHYYGRQPGFCHATHGYRGIDHQFGVKLLLWS
jgi:hypothetical protein